MLWQRKRSLTIVLIAWIGAGCWVLSAHEAASASWQGALEDGRQIRVDPNSNRPIIQSGVGTGAPLWDGVHRLRDGSVITIRSGIMVPNEAVMSLRRPEPPANRTVPELDPVCDDLVLKTCGLTTECGEKEACDLAKQLRAAHWQAARDNAMGNDWSTSHCQSALADDKTFPACDAARTSMTAPCRRLVALLCGRSDRCAASEACGVSRRLLALEQAQQTDIGAELGSAPQRQCQDLLARHAFFPPCR